MRFALWITATALGGNLSSSSSLQYSAASSSSFKSCLISRCLDKYKDLIGRFGNRLVPLKLLGSLGREWAEKHGLQKRFESLSDWPACIDDIKIMVSGFWIQCRISYLSQLLAFVPINSFGLLLLHLFGTTGSALTCKISKISCDLFPPLCSNVLNCSY